MFQFPSEKPFFCLHGYNFPFVYGIILILEKRKRCTSSDMVQWNSADFECGSLLRKTALYFKELHLRQ